MKLNVGLELAPMLRRLLEACRWRLLSRGAIFLLAGAAVGSSLTETAISQPRPRDAAVSQSLSSQTQNTSGFARGQRSVQPTFQGQAKPTSPPPRRTATKSKLNVFFNPPRKGAPSGTRSGASRGSDCATSNRSMQRHLTAIIPEEHPALTASSHPTFFVYVPPTEASQALFNLRNSRSEVIFQAEIALSGNNRLVPITLPATAPALQTGDRYRWMVAVLCGGKLEPASPTTSGWVQRIAAPAPPATATSPLEKAVFYGAQGLWYDMLAALAQQRRLNPGDLALARNWQDLLTAAGLPEIATIPLAD
jgi:hypothetical protein